MLPLLLLSGTLFGAEPNTPSLRPILELGRELVYAGTIDETITRPGVRYNRIYDLEARIFVLHGEKDFCEVALMTSLNPRRDAVRDAGVGTPEGVVRLERAKIDARGRVALLPAGPIAGPGAERPYPAYPLDGIVTLEAGFFAVQPPERANVGDSWSVVSADQSLVLWQIEAIEVIKGLRCFRILAKQEAPLDAKRSGSFTRRDRLWISPLNGYAGRIERHYERFDNPAGNQGTSVVLTLDLVSRMQYRGRLFDERRQEIEQLFLFREQFDQLLPGIGRMDGRPFELLRQKIRAWEDRSRPTDYRAALPHLLSLIEAGRRGDLPPSLVAAEPLPVASGLTVGAPVPDIIALDPLGRNPTRLSELKGTPIVLLYYQPSSATAEACVKYASAIAHHYGKRVRVLILAVGATPAQLAAQQDTFQPLVPLLLGTDAAQAHGIDNTPSFVILDAEGKVVEQVIGWGGPIATKVRAALERICPSR